MKKTGTFLILGLFFFYGQLLASDISVTKVIKKPSSRADVVLNGALLIKEVWIRSDSGNKIVELPKYASKKGKVYEQVKLLTEQARTAALTALLSGKPSAGKAGPLSFVVGRMKSYNGTSRLKAFSSVCFNGAVEVECKVMSGDTGFWISWPGARNSKSKRWEDSVKIIDMKLKNDAESAILEKYRNFAEENAK